MTKDEFNKLSSHPLQSWEWGEFRKKTGVKVVRLTRFEKDKLVETAQITIHKIPRTPYTIGYFPKGKIPSEEMLAQLVEAGKQNNCIFIKLEPNIEKNNSQLSIFNYPFFIVPSPHPLFTKYNFQLDLTRSEEELLASFHPKTRYNLRVAQKHGVTVEEDNSNEGFNEYLRLTFETTKRQKFYAHDEKYHHQMWESLREDGMAHLFLAKYKEGNQTHVLTAWIVFIFNEVLYYPYGASSEKFRSVMASNLMMWETIRFGKRTGAKNYDLWGALGENPDPKDPWYGFHRFKQGYNPKHIEYAGSFDLVIKPHLYKIYNSVYNVRKILLHLKSSI